MMEYPQSIGDGAEHPSEKGHSARLRLASIAVEVVESAAAVC